MRCTMMSSGRLLRMCSASWSVTELGNSKPFLFPTVILPTSLVPAMDVFTTGMSAESSFWNTL